jgi:hypothetical protein
MLIMTGGGADSDMSRMFVAAQNEKAGIQWMPASA